MPNFSLKLGNLYVPALVTGLLNFIESFLCAKMFAARYGETVSPNREMVAIGLANAVSSLFGTFPASASLSRTTLAAQNGAQTPASSRRWSSRLALLFCCR
jgi:MFS superfamily sulfate permease-like transporter